jgi:uncharacterized membrane protein
MQTKTVILSTAMSVAISSAAVADLTVLPPDVPLLESISNTGVAASSLAGSEFVLWSGGKGVTSLGGSTIPYPSNDVDAAEISDDGLFVSGSAVDAATGEVQLARYDVVAGAWTTLGSLGITSGGPEASSGWTISGDGQTVAGSSFTTSGGFRAAVAWDSATGSLVTIDPDSASGSSLIHGANADGSVLTGSKDGSGAVVWVDGVLAEIPVPGFGGQGGVVSADGRWVAGFSRGIGPAGLADGWRYDTTTATFESFPAAASRNRARSTGISSDGSMIVGTSWIGPNPLNSAVAWVWREGVGTVDLPAYLDELGIASDPTYTFRRVADMSADGRWLVGWGETAGGELTSWVLEIPQDESCLGDVDGSGAVGFDDIVLVLAAWGDCAGCPEDIDGSGAVAFDDLVLLLSAFGRCP